jgi:4-carboxymuconolactone decarboxylase
MSPRYTPIGPDALDDDQRALYDAILNGPRGASGTANLVASDGSLQGPFGPMLLSPAVGGPLQATGAALRFETGLPAAVRELATLVVAGAWGCEFEWKAHEPLALRAGVPAAVIDAVRDGVDVDFGDETLSTVHQAVKQLLTTISSRRTPTIV